MTTKKQALVLLSGGLDSATTLAIALDAGFAVTAMSFDYGQRHKVELARSRALCDRYNVPHLLVPLPLDRFGGSALTDPDIAVPDLPDDVIGRDIPITYVPARNTIFLAVAAGWCEAHGVRDIFIGTNAVDYSGYPDCRPAFIESMEQAITLGTRCADDGTRFTIHTPLARLTKADIIRKGLALGVDYSLTSTCYNPHSNGNPCGRCDACKLRRKGFLEAGTVDPLPYPDETQ